MALAEDFQSVPWDSLWSLVFIWADACARLDLADRADELYQLLAPFSGQFAGGGLVFGSIDWALGRLATILERYEQAGRHFASAVDTEERLGAPLFVARTRAGWARALIARGRRKDLTGAQHMLDQAEEMAGRFGAGLIAGEVQEGRASLATIGQRE